jgi:phage tail-like protein
MKSNEIEKLLPQVFQSAMRPQTPLTALLNLMEALHEPAEAILAQVDTTFNPYHMPERFVPYMARWVDLDRFFPAAGNAHVAAGAVADVLSTGNGRLRELIAAAAYLSQWRGTLEGLSLFLETATGSSGFEVNEHVEDTNGMPRPYHVHIKAPQSCARDRSLIERIIDQEKPAYVTYDLEFA